jgi:hypothetical protein
MSRFGYSTKLDKTQPSHGLTAVCLGCPKLTLEFVRLTHNLKVIGSNPIPATRHQALENVSFSRVFCSRILARNFVRGSVVESAEGKSQRKIDGVGRDVMTQL